jgi:hypothetical protein
VPEESPEVDKEHGADKLLGVRLVFPEVYGDDLAGNRMEVDMVASSSFEVPFPIHPYGENRRVVFREEYHRRGSLFELFLVGR